MKWILAICLLSYLNSCAKGTELIAPADESCCLMSVIYDTVHQGHIICDSTSYLFACYNFDCSSCIAAMEETEKFLKSYSNVCYIVYSQDSITLSYYIQKIAPRATVLYDKNNAFFIANRHRYNLARDFPVFIIKKGHLIYANNPLKNGLQKIIFKRKAKDFLKQKNK